MKNFLFIIGALITIQFTACGPGGGSEDGEGASDTTQIKTDAFTYSVDTMEFQGYMAWDAAIEGKRPGILVVHEWWGHNEYARKRAEMLAELGYTALALDMFGDGKTADHPKEAMGFVQEVMSGAGVATARFDKALEILRQHPTVNPDNLGAIGYCFGGSIVLNMARMGKELDGVVSFHGGLSSLTPAKPGEVDARVLVLHGADDSMNPDSVVNAFKAEMESANVNYEFIAYKGAKHSFTNPHADSMGRALGMDIAYDAESDKKSWEEMKEFFNEVFQ